MASNKTVVQVVTNEEKVRKNMAIQRGRRLAVRWVLFAISLIVLLLLLKWGFGKIRDFLFDDNPHFVFRELRFEETTHFTNKSIQTYLEELGDDNGCIIGRTNLLNLDIGKLRQTFLANPLIESVEIRHIMPSTLDIRIKERTAIAYVSNAQTVTGLIDKNGVVFPKVDNRGLDENLPYIANVQNAEHLPMGTKSEDKYLLSAIEFINEVTIRPQIDGIAYTTYVIKINYEREWLECTLKPLFSNPVFPKGLLILIPCDKEKMLEAFERLEAILKIKLKEGSTLSFADITLQYNVNTRD
ncbi:MAG: FtsQ-type POTRA domain-containing protein [Victivallales bacterium]|nr:FtsQ-type POTRA domain-containing protein [Victivallales bacterium]